MNGSRLVAALLVTTALSTLAGCGQDEIPARPAGARPAEPTATAAAPAAAGPGAPTADARYVGAEACRECHAHQHRLWKNSHHAKAMLPATADSVRGDFGDAVGETTFAFAGATTSFRRDGDRFLVTAEGPDGKPREYPVTHTFGWWPLQQLLVSFPGGRRQALDVCWDARAKAEGGQRWFRLRPEEGRLPPGDLLHWTQPYQNWNLMCAECHSTDLSKGYRPDEDRYETTWSEVDVSCEACHGPGSRHVEWARAVEQGGAAAGAAYGEDRGLTVILKDRAPAAWNLDPAAGIWKRDPAQRSRTEVETCAPCHARRSALAKGRPGQPLLDRIRPMLLDPGLYHADGQILEEVYEHGSFLQSKMYAKGITCSDCHGKHGSKASTGGTSQVCANCHLAEKFAAKSHHFHEPGSKGSRCVECHMPARDYMVVHTRRDHSIRIPRPDLTQKIGVPNACDACHADKGIAWQVDAYVRWWGPKRFQTKHWGEAIHAGREGAPGAAAALTAVLADPEVPAIARATAASLLGRDVEETSIAALARAAADRDPLLRLGAAQGGGDLSDAGARWRVLDALLDDPLLAVRIEATRGLIAARAAAPSEPRRLRLDAGIEAYRRSLAADADWAEARGALGNLALDLEDPKGAEREYLAAVRLNPAFAPTRVNLADLYRRLGREADGEKVLREGLALSPSDPGLHHALGLLLVRRGSTAEALPHLATAADHPTHVPRYGYVQAVALDSSGDAAGARRAIDGVLAHRPFDPDSLAFLADLAARTGDRRAALGAARLLVEVRPRDEGARRMLEAIERAGR